MQITNQNIDFLIKGASVLACGGGLAYEDQLKDIKKLLPKLSIELVKLRQLDGEDTVMTVCEIGPSDAPVIDKTMLPVLAKKFFALSNLPLPKAVLPFEIGQESITLEAAHLLNLPVLDTDTAGQRAVPMLGLDLLSLSAKSIKPGPVIARNSKGQELVISDKNNTPEIIEDKLRAFSSKSEGVVLVLSNHQKAGPLKKVLKHSAYSKAIKLGKNGLKTISEQIILKKLVKVIDIKKNHKDGFVCIEISLLDINGNKLFIKTKNEYISLRDDSGKISHTFPYLISLLDKHSLTGIASNSLKTNKEYAAVVIKPIEGWKGFN